MKITYYQVLDNNCLPTFPEDLCKRKFSSYSKCYSATKDILDKYPKIFEEMKSFYIKSFEMEVE